MAYYRLGMFGKRGEMPPLPRNCEARAVGYALDNPGEAGLVRLTGCPFGTSGKSALEMRARFEIAQVRRPVPGEGLPRSRMGSGGDA